MTKNKGPFSPLSAIGFEILLSLAEGKRHGYHLMLDIAERTQGRLRLHPGTLYRAISRLVDDGLLDEVEPAAEEERRRYYRLTTLGRRRARLEAERLADQVAAARSKRLLEQTDAE